MINEIRHERSGDFVSLKLYHSIEIMNDTFMIKTTEMMFKLFDLRKNYLSGAKSSELKKEILRKQRNVLRISIPLLFILSLAGMFVGTFLVNYFNL